MMHRTLSSLFLSLVMVASLMAGLISCNDVLLHRESAGFTVSLVMPGRDLRSSDGGGDTFNGTAWLELEDGTTLQSQPMAAETGASVSLTFDPVEAGTKLRVRVELVDAAESHSKYVGASDWIVVEARENSVDVLLEAATTVTTWTELSSAVADSATSIIYVDAATMTAESGITFNGNKQIIPLQDLTITVALASVTDEVFPGLFFIQPDSNISLGNDDYTITLNDSNMNNCAVGLIWSEGTLSMTNVVAENFTNGNGLLYSTGTSILNNVSLSWNWQSGTAAITIGSSDSGENTLEIGQNVAISEVGFVVEADAPCQPRIQLNANSSLKVDSPKIKINVTYFADATQTTSPPDGLQIVSVGDYAGDPNALFEVVGNDGAIYTLDGEGRLVVPTVEPSAPAETVVSSIDLNNPDTLVGMYDITFFWKNAGVAVLTNDCLKLNELSDAAASGDVVCQDNENVTLTGEATISKNMNGEFTIITKVQMAGGIFDNPNSNPALSTEANKKTFDNNKYNFTVYTPIPATEFSPNGINFNGTSKGTSGRNLTESISSPDDTYTLVLQAENTLLINMTSKSNGTDAEVRVIMKKKNDHIMTLEENKPYSTPAITGFVTKPAVQ